MKLLENAQRGTITLADGSKIYTYDDGNSCSCHGKGKGICLRHLKHLSQHQIPLEESALKLSGVLKENV